MPKGCKFAPRCKYAMDICHQQEPELADINEAGTYVGVPVRRVNDEE